MIARALVLVVSAAALLGGCGQRERRQPSPVQSAAQQQRATPRFVLRGGRVVVELPLTPRQSKLARGRVDELTGRRLLRVSLDQRAAPPLVGRYRQTGQALELRPALRLMAGRRYRATAGAAVTRYVARGPVKSAARTTRVLAIYPTRDVLPANQLKLYVRFSAPMQGGDAFFDSIELVDEASGRAVRGAFRRLPLWSRDRRTATVLFHPGRVKRGIGIARGLAPILRAGRRYRLRLGSALRDARGAPLSRAYVKRFSVVAADRRRPDPRSWRLVAPRAGTRAPLRVQLDEPLDAELAREALSLRDDAGRPVRATATVALGETSLTLTPAKPWRRATYRLVVDALRTMDLAGNNVARRFDERVGAKRRQAPVLRFAPLPRHAGG